MTLFLLIFYFLTLLSAGYAVLSLIAPQKRSSIELLSLVMILGAGTTGMILFYLTMIDIKPSMSVMVMIMLISLATTSIGMRNDRMIHFPIPGKFSSKEKIVFSVSTFIILFFLGIVTAQALLMPLDDIDAFAHWFFKAKILTTEGLQEGGTFFLLPVSYSHLDYPLMVPFLVSGIFTFLGYFDDMLGKAIFPFLYIGALIFIYSSLRWKLSRIVSITLTLIFMTTPSMIRWTSSGMADMPLTIFYAGSIFYLVKFISEEKTEDLIIAIMMTIFCAFTKNEGIALAFINIAIFAFIYPLFPFSKKRLKYVAIFAGTFILFMLPWFYWVKDIPHTHENYPGRILTILSHENLKRIGEISLLFIQHISQISRWGFLWIILPFVFVLNPKICRHKFVTAMWLLLISQIALYFVIFIITPWGVEFLALSALERLLLHCSPAVIYLIAFYLSGDQKPSNSDG